MTTSNPNPSAEAQVRADDRAHVFHSWSAQGKINPMPVAAAEGPRIYDYEGKGYLDFGSQLVSANLGHNHPDLVAAIREQAGRVTNLNPAFANDVRGELARRIVESAQGEFSHVFFTNGGADAVEHAIRMARLHTGKDKILAAYRSYHGATGSAIMATGEGRRLGNPTTDGDIYHFWGPFLYRSAFHSDSPEQECARALEHLEQTIIFEGPGQIAAIMLESMVGSSGVIAPPEGYLRGVRELCDKYGILYIADEVMVGFGRTGKLFAYEHGGADLAPDLVTFAKGVNSGYVPLGGVLIHPAIVETFSERPYPGGLTYSGHPLACAPGVAALDVYEREGIFERVARLGAEVIGPRLREIAEKHPSVGEVRGQGFFWAIEFVRDRATKEPLTDLGEFAAYCKEHGVWPMVSANRTHIAPPLNIPEEDLIQGLEVIEAAVARADAAL
ncbi:MULTISPECIES: aspartate aminotransferase family protein [unclassified Corynebacterium]|uniref:aspartate aminotransferase family protein n=1 Tax=unclassified Corynebacterium TaxID=2624378 RepID=UPI0029CA0B93|nr:MULTISPECIES: aspartate aminotransferase family protein [unclassified Corynebacterium]WPF65794.1 aspartate aminotransferase family protein [Corynebacterium sp. 22KM0430]WPF68288.1 aspartate aminotransferase family protein [Corynebacterium sp. 21KM1197]